MTPYKFKKLSDAVEGYTTLELFEEAQKLLDELPPKFKITKEVIRLHMTLLVKQKEYHKASFLAETLSLFEPENVEGLLMVASCRYKAGAFDNALEWLMSVEKNCSGDATFHYLRAQCHAALGNIDAAKTALKTASEMSEELKQRSLDDPVFKSIWE